MCSMLQCDPLNYDIHVYQEVPYCTIRYGTWWGSQASSTTSCNKGRQMRLIKLPSIPNLPQELLVRCHSTSPQWYYKCIGGWYYKCIGKGTPRGATGKCNRGKALVMRISFCCFQLDRVEQEQKESRCKGGKTVIPCTYTLSVMKMDYTSTEQEQTEENSAHNKRLDEGRTRSR